jgi:large subunit ribosomal protein L15
MGRSSAAAGLDAGLPPVKGPVAVSGCGAKSRPTRPGFEGGQTPLYRRLPKLKGFELINQKVYTVVNVSALAGLPAKSIVTLDTLLAAGILTQNDGPLKILGDGELKVALNVTAGAFTASAKAKIEAAGGTCEAIVKQVWMRDRSVPKKKK